MKHDQIARALARRGRISHAEARDKMDELVHEILKSLRGGHKTAVPGVGHLICLPRPIAANPDARGKRT